MKKVTILKKQDSSWNITTTHQFLNRDYQIDEFGNFYLNGKLRISKPDNKNSIRFILIDDNNRNVHFSTHQILLQTYQPEGLVNGVSVDHKDRNRLNNNLSNLRYATHKQQYENRDGATCKHKKVVCLNNGVVYISCKHAEIELRLPKNKVSAVARGVVKSVHGLRFSYQL